MFELLVVMGIVAVLVMLAVPSMQTAVESGQRSSGLSETMAMIAAARAQAVARQVPVALCPSTDQASCSGDNWEDGWIMFVDDGAGGSASDGNRTSPEEILRVGTAASGAVTIRSHNFADAGAIEFDLEGMTVERGTIMICDAAGKEAASALVLNISGQSRIATDDVVTAGCIGCVEKDDGAEATCP
jgi:type IV fimbrial biogenesis protein FimT